jgi:hypothetical protein
MSSTETPPQLSQKYATGQGRVMADAPEHDTDGRSRRSEHASASGSTASAGHSGLVCRAQEQERPDHERSWDVHMAEAVAFLLSAHAILEGLSSESFGDPRAARLIASGCGKVFEALSTLDDCSVTQWIKGGAIAGIGCSYPPLPSWWSCLAELA